MIINPYQFNWPNNFLYQILFKYQFTLNLQSLYKRFFKDTINSNRSNYLINFFKFESYNELGEDMVDQQITSSNNSRLTGTILLTN